MIIGIVAADRHWGIGKKNGLLFNLPEDMKFFRTQTKDKIVACGENTLLSFPGGKPLKGRSTVVLCPEGHEYNDCICMHTFEDFIKTLKVLSITNDIYIIGGGMIYKSMLPYYDKVLVNKVDAKDPEATVFFPNLDVDDNFYLAYSDEPKQDGDYITTLCTYRRYNIMTSDEMQKVRITTAYNNINLDNIELFEDALYRS